MHGPSNRSASKDSILQFLSRRTIHEQITAVEIQGYGTKFLSKKKKEKLVKSPGAQSSAPAGGGHFEVKGKGQRDRVLFNEAELSAQMEILEAFGWSLPGSIHVDPLDAETQLKVAEYPVGERQDRQSVFPAASVRPAIGEPQLKLQVSRTYRYGIVNHEGPATESF